MTQAQIGEMACEMVALQDNKLKKRYPLLIIVLCVGLFVLGGFGIAHAAKGYAGLGIGLAKGKFDKASFSFDTDDLSRDESMWRVLCGFQLNDNFGIEGGYVNFRKARVSENTYNDYFETEMRGFEFAPVGFLPVGKDFWVFAGAGLISWSSDMTTYSAMFGTDTKSVSGSSLALSFGVNYDFSKKIGLRAEYTRYAIDKAKAGAGDFNAISINGVFAFYR